MRVKKFMAAVAAAALSLGLTAGAAQAAPQPIRVDSEGVVTGGYLQNQFGEMGKYQTTSTIKDVECGLVYKVYNIILKNDHNNKIKHTCWGTFPDGTKSPAGVQFTYPKNIAKMGKLPVIIYTPGIGAEPGQMAQVYKFLASHGYIVATTYTWLNWTGYTDVQGAAALYKEFQDKNSPLYGHIDTSKVVLTGHSAGGGSTESASGWLLPKVQKEFPGMKIVAAIPLQPGPSVFVQGEYITIPTFVVSGEKDTICPDDAWVRPIWKKITKAPAWIAMLKGAPHGQAMGGVENSANAASILAFAELYVHNNPVARDIFIGSNYFLKNDAAFMKVERNAKAETLK